VRVRAAEALHVDLLAGDAADDVGAGDEDPPGRRQDDHIGQCGTVRGAAGRRAEHHGYLRDPAGRADVRREAPTDLGPPPLPCRATGGLLKLSRSAQTWGVRLLLLSDTHVPRRAHDLPNEVWAAVDQADVVIHAGDWVSLDLVDRLTARAGRLVACWGNNDGPEIRAVLPETAHVTLNGLRFVVIHETGQAKGRGCRMAAAYPDTDVLVFGHSHIPWDTTITHVNSSNRAARTLRLLNPGSPTDRRRQPTCTYLSAVVTDQGSIEVTLHHLPTTVTD